MPKKLRIAWFSVLNCGDEESSSISAYTSGCLLPRLRERFEIELYHDSFESYPGFETRHYLDAVMRHRTNPYDVFFYQMEDHRAASFARIHLGLMPGIVLFHDLMLSSHGPEPILNSPWRETLSKFRDPGHPWPARGSEFTQGGPLGYREAGYAAAALFSNPAAHADYRNNVEARLALPGEAPRSFYLPLPVECQENTARGVRDGEVLRIAYCGSPRIEHRSHKLCAALARLSTPWQLHWLLDADELTHAQEIAGEFELNNVHFSCGRSPGRWSALVTQCDAAVHTLFSVFGQPGPYLQLSLMAGLPTVVTRFASCELLPDNCVYKIEPGETEAAELCEVLRHVAGGRNPAASARIRAYARENFDAASVALDLAAVFEEQAGYLARVLARWDDLGREAHRALHQEVRGFAGENFDSMMRPVMQELGWV